MSNLNKICLVSLLLIITTSCQRHKSIALFDGKTFDGWEASDTAFRVASYQADMDSPFSLWGTLIDECRADLSRYPEPEYYPAVILKMLDRDIIQDIVKPYGWNEIEILAIGKKIEIKTN
jgi:hypothetical protein